MNCYVLMSEDPITGEPYVCCSSFNKEEMDRALTYKVDQRYKGNDKTTSKFWIDDFNYQTHEIGLRGKVCLRKEPLNFYCANDFYRHPSIHEDLLSDELLREMFSDVAYNNSIRMEPDQIKTRLIYQTSEVEIYTIWYQEQPFMIAYFGGFEGFNRFITDREIYKVVIKYLQELNPPRVYDDECLEPTVRTWQLNIFSGKDIPSL